MQRYEELAEALRERERIQRQIVRLTAEHDQLAAAVRDASAESGEPDG